MMAINRFNEYVQPVKFAIMCEGEDKFVYNAVNGNCPADEFKASVGGVVEDEIVSVKVGQ